MLKMFHMRMMAGRLFAAAAADWELGVRFANVWEW